MMTTLALLAMSIVPALREPVTERVDLVEVNHFYDDQGRLVFDQVIFYDWSPSEGRHHVRAWRLIKSPDQLPQRDWQRGGYVVNWRDGEVWREVRATGYRESWTQYDPELIEREYLPKEKRIELKPANACRSARGGS